MEMLKNFSNEEDKWIFQPIGDVDIHNSEDFKSEILDLYNEENKDIIIDGSNLNYVDSTGLGALIYIYNEVHEKGNTIYLDNLKPNILKIIDITALDKVFNIRGGEDE